MKSDISKQRSDIVFIGSGISTSFSLLSFLDQLKDSDISREIKIIILDKWDEFNKGLPYGDRSGASVLLITSLRNFIPEPELTPFIEWLNLNKDELLAEFIESGGQLSKNWIENHRSEIDQNQWEELFIPRFFFGHYIDEKVNRKIDECRKVCPLSVEFRQGKAIDLHKNDGYWTVQLKEGGVLESEKVVLSVGSLPMRYLWKESRVVRDEELLFINDIYTKSLQRSLSDIEKFLDKKEEEKVNVAIIGANASALEILYKLNDVDSIRSRVEKFTFVSTYGVLPDSEIAPDKQKLFQPANLQALQQKAKLRASDISDAAFKDLKIADKLELGAFSTVNIISSAFGQLLGNLSDQEL
ncbi:MAG: FAD/NAD(P)-binding protein, partial [Flavobacteriaceae bacterium]